MTNTNHIAANHAANAFRPAQVWLAQNGLAAAWEIYQGAAEGQEETTLRDMVWRLEQGRELSGKQVNYLRILMERIERKGARAAQWAAESATASDVPTGRIEIEGEVVTTKLQESRFGTQLKMLVKHATGYMVWGTVPRAIDGLAKGDTVRFTATVEPSPSDPKFGFFSRPTGAAVVNKAVLTRAE